MKGLLRRLRGIIGTGLTWAVGWAGLWGAVLLVGAGLGRFQWLDFGSFVTAELGVAVIGFIAGSGFGVLLSILERHKKLENLSFRRIALWGGIGGLALAAIFGLGLPNLALTIVLTLAGIGSAAGSVALAKRASDTKLIEGEEDPLLSLEGE